MQPTAGSLGSAALSGDSMYPQGLDENPPIPCWWPVRRDDIRMKASPDPGTGVGLWETSREGGDWRWAGACVRGDWSPNHERY